MERISPDEFLIMGQYFHRVRVLEEYMREFARGSMLAVDVFFCLTRDAPFCRIINADRKCRQSKDDAKEDKSVDAKKKSPEKANERE